MELVPAFAYLIGGFALLVIGGDALVKAAISVAVKTKIPPAIISLTVIAAGTSAPELVTSLIAALDAKPDLAVGNVIGSNVFNIFAILGFSYLIKPSRAINSGLSFEWIILLIITAATIFMINDLRLSQIEGLIFILAFVSILYVSVKRARKKGFNAEDDDEEITTLKNAFFDVLYVGIGIGALVGGAHLALNGGLLIGEWMGWSEKVIGISIVSVGTGLPELATSAVAAYRGRSDIAIGNVIGSNLMNTLAVLGGTALITPLTISSQIVQIDTWVLLLTTFLLVGAVFGIKLAVNRFAGALYLTAYALYMYGTFSNWSFL